MNHFSSLPPVWLTLPFVALLLMIATGPLFYPHFWHRYYTWIAPALSGVVVLYYVIQLGDRAHPLEALIDYVQFILLLSALYIISSGILIELRGASKPWNNLGILWTGAILSNLIGTTGASMLLIRPYMRLNRKRLSAYHVVFFIFMVSNVGGCLTPIGDPPLFLGFLKGVGFFWMLQHALLPWLVALGLLSGIFYVLDARDSQAVGTKAGMPHQGSWLKIEGKSQFFLFLVVIGALFLDPNKWSWVPGIDVGHGEGRISFVRELILLVVIAWAYLRSDPKILAANNFSFEPLKEVIFVFIGIFGTMMPALALTKHFAETHADWINPHLLYWGTGTFSSLLDNAPTYLNALAAGMGSKGLDITRTEDVLLYAKAYGPNLLAMSLAAVFFGAMTYVGNGPNFMVRAIAEEEKVQMPSFLGYLWYSLRFLLPVLLVVWLLFIV